MSEENDFPKEAIDPYMRLLQELGMEKASKSSDNRLMNNPYQQAHRITLGLAVAYHDGLDKPDQTRVEERARFMARWPKDKLLKLAIACKREDRHKDPEYCEALVMSLLLAEQQEA